MFGSLPARLRPAYPEKIARQRQLALKLIYHSGDARLNC